MRHFDDWLRVRANVVGLDDTYLEQGGGPGAAVPPPSGPPSTHTKPKHSKGFMSMPRTAGGMAGKDWGSMPGFHWWDQKRKDPRSWFNRPTSAQDVIDAPNVKKATEVLADNLGLSVTPNSPLERNLKSIVIARIYGPKVSKVEIGPLQRVWRELLKGKPPLWSQVGLTKPEDIVSHIPVEYTGPARAPRSKGGKHPLGWEEKHGYGEDYYIDLAAREWSDRIGEQIRQKQATKQQITGVGGGGLGGTGPGLGGTPPGGGGLPSYPHAGKKGARWPKPKSTRAPTFVTNMEKLIADLKTHYTSGGALLTKDQSHLLRGIQKLIDDYKRDAGLII